MKINDIHRIQGINQYQQTNKQEREVKQKAAKKDEISISDEAKALLEQTKEADTGASQKIQALKEQVKNGTYQVDPQKVAEKIIKTMFRSEA